MNNISPKKLLCTSRNYLQILFENVCVNLRNTLFNTNGIMSTKRLNLKNRSKMNMILLLVLILTSFDLIAFIRCANELKLSDLKWTLIDANEKIVSETINVPCGVYTDLAETGTTLQTVFQNCNDEEYQYVGEFSWIYSINFKYILEELFFGKKEIVFHGLDGLATITLNGHVLGTATNSFVRYRYDVTKHLFAENELKITFEGPIESAKRLAKDSVFAVPPSCVPVSYKGICHVNFLRRVQASFSWDLAPTVPSVGIWKPVELIAYEDDLIIRDITVVTTQNVDTKVWTVDVKVFCDRAKAEIENDIFDKMKISLSTNNDEQMEAEFAVIIAAHSIQREIIVQKKFEVPDDKVTLWMPNEFGEQKLYKLTASFTEERHGNVKQEKSIKIGFRTIELVQNEIDPTQPKKGRSFYFKINGRSIFIKGANYIPDSILPEKNGDLDTLKNLLQSVKIVHMNMIRVWAGGRYESDLFYELCDKYGIMVWQDMMFADSMYPVDKAFMDSVTEEVTQQVRRLQHHACIVIWNGNDENELALAKNWYGTRSKYEFHKFAYIQLYVNTIRAAIFAVDESRPFITSSPTNGLKNERKGIANNPNSPLYGDAHNYIFTSYFRTDDLKMARFATEYGFQSIPSMSTWKTVGSEKDLERLDSKFMQRRQRYSRGNVPLLDAILNQFGGKPSELKKLIYLSQINQAMLVKVQTEWYRRWKKEVTKGGEGYTMGAMYWQLNDVWQTISWSSIEYGGKWKMLHYFAKSFFGKVIVTAELNEQGITVHVVSDKSVDIPKAIVQYDIYSWNSMTPIDTLQDEILIEAEKSKMINSTTAKLLFGTYEECVTKKKNWTLKGNGLDYKKKCFLKLTLKVPNKNDYMIIHENFLYPKPFKSIENLTDCSSLQVSVKHCEPVIECVDKDADDCYTQTKCVFDVEARTDGICLFVWIDVGNVRGRFSDNGFTMTETKKTLRFYSPDKIEEKDFQGVIQVSVLDQLLLSYVSSKNDYKYENFRPKLQTLSSFNKR